MEKNNLTPEEEEKGHDLAIAISKRDYTAHVPDYVGGAQEMFNLLWPVVKRAYTDGVYGEYSHEMTPEQYCSKLLNGLKYKVDGK